MYTSSYSEAAFPARPVVRNFRVAVPDISWDATFPEAIVDTGSDVSYIPERYLAELQAQSSSTGFHLKNERVTIEGIAGQETGIPLFYLRFDIPDIPISPTTAGFVLYEDYVVLGRNILNQFHVVLNGRGVVTELPTLQIDVPH
jgi:hypothetical protein